LSRKYKFHNKEGLYFVSFATVYWIDVFTRDEYFQIMVENLNFCRKEKGMEIYCWCVMPSHAHLIFKDKNNNPGKLLGQFKSHTSKKLQEAIENNPKESRKDRAGDPVAALDDGTGGAEKQQRKEKAILARSGEPPA